MKLMTKKLEKRFEQVGSQEKVKDPVIIAKFFTPFGTGRWYATEYDPVNKTFFGYVSIFGGWDDEWGYFSLVELESGKCSFGTGIERDRHWTETKASVVIR